MHVRLRADTYLWLPQRPLPAYWDPVPVAPISAYMHHIRRSASRRGVHLLTVALLGCALKATPAHDPLTPHGKHRSCVTQLGSNPALCTPGPAKS